MTADSPCRCRFIGVTCERGHRDRSDGPGPARPTWKAAVPEADEFLLPILEIVPLQLFAYFTAVQRGINVDDKSRQLTESCTNLGTLNGWFRRAFKVDKASGPLPELANRPIRRRSMPSDSACSRMCPSKAPRSASGLRFV